MEAYRHTVQYYETDRMGITHHSNYIRWMEEARVAFLDGLGWSYGKLEEEGIVSPVTAIECRFRASTTFADVISIEVTVSEFKGAVLKLSYVMTNEDGKTVFEAKSEHCFLSREGKVIRLSRDYPEFAKLLETLAEGE